MDDGIDLAEALLGLHGFRVLEAGCASIARHYGRQWNGKCLLDPPTYSFEKKPGNPPASASLTTPTRPPARTDLGSRGIEQLHTGVRVARRAGERLGADLQPPGDLRPPIRQVVRRVPGDGGILDAAQLAHQPREGGGPSSLLAGEDPHRCITLLVGGGLVDAEQQRHHRRTTTPRVALEFAQSDDA